MEAVEDGGVQQERRYGLDPLGVLQRADPEGPEVWYGSYQLGDDGDGEVVVAGDEDVEVQDGIDVIQVGGGDGLEGGDHWGGLDDLLYHLSRGFGLVDVLPLGEWREVEKLLPPGHRDDGGDYDMLWGEVLLQLQEGGDCGLGR